MTNPRFFKFQKFTLDTYERTLSQNGTTKTLTPKLCKLLVLLIRHQGRTLFRKTIMEEVWDTDYVGDTRTLDVHMRWLREKVEDDPAHPQYILTIRGAGYCLIAEPK